MTGSIQKKKYKSLSWISYKSPSPIHAGWNCPAVFRWIPSSAAFPKNAATPTRRQKQERNLWGHHLRRGFFPHSFKIFPSWFLPIDLVSFYVDGVIFFLEFWRILGTKTVAISLSSFHCPETKPCEALEKSKWNISQWGPDAVRCLASDRTGTSDRTYSVFKWTARDALCLEFIPAQDCEHSRQ